MQLSRIMVHLDPSKINSDWSDGQIVEEDGWFYWADTNLPVMIQYDNQTYNLNRGLFAPIIPPVLGRNRLLLAARQRAALAMIVKNAKLPLGMERNQITFMLGGFTCWAPRSVHFSAGVYADDILDTLNERGLWIEDDTGEGGEFVSLRHDLRGYVHLHRINQESVRLYLGA